MTSIIEIAAESLRRGTITIDGFVVEHSPMVDSFGTVAVRGVNRDGSIEKRVWPARTLVPVRG